MRIIAAWTVLSLAIPVDAHALRLRLGWDDMRAVASHAEIGPHISVRTYKDGSPRSANSPKRTVKGRLQEITDTGIALKETPRKPSRVLSRESVHAVRLMPRKGEKFKGHPYRYRLAAVFGAVPIWIGTFFLGISLGGIQEGPLFKTGEGFHGAVPAFILPYVAYRVAWWADRRMGAIVIELDHRPTIGMKQ